MYPALFEFIILITTTNDILTLVVITTPLNLCEHSTNSSRCTYIWQDPQTVDAASLMIRLREPPPAHSAMSINWITPSKSPVA